MLCVLKDMKPCKYILVALFMLAVLPARAGDIRLGINPNPAQNQVSITVEGQTIGTQQPEIFTVLGEKITLTPPRKEGNAFIFNTSGIPDGIYLIKYGTGDQAVVKRLKIQH